MLNNKYNGKCFGYKQERKYIHLFYTILNKSVHLYKLPVKFSPKRVFLDIVADKLYLFLVDINDFTHGYEFSLYYSSKKSVTKLKETTNWDFIEIKTKK